MPDDLDVLTPGHFLIGTSLSALPQEDLEDLFTAFIRFDDYSTRPQRKINDKLAPIREVFDLFVQNCIMAYSPGSHRGCPFRVYMKSKPDKYGLKIWAMADSKNSYSANLQVYLGKINNKPEKNQGERVVLDLVEPLGTGYGVTTDNFFTSLPLADKLAEKKLTLCGTLRKNKSYIPNELQPKLFRPEFSSALVFATNDS
ncbi:uncharacterized protein LOC126744765 [Anthonomus grandis grandis]|uniref:uncharacterized protein LOC126744765 n=1 Tax=Anthonomus grandis grandis TaxID=2921223 RepID=UPI0021659975|nr:uncharacterized protein LOC126744765 [Anthonomus grandis grandis]